MNQTKKQIGVFFAALLLAFAGFSITASHQALADHGCAHGQVYCGGGCHSSPDMCPGHDHHGAEPGSSHGCGSGQVYCGGGCHSSPSMCPGNGGNHGGNGGGNSGSHSCGYGTHWDGWQCVADGGSHNCGYGTHWDGWQCVSNGYGQPACPPGYYWNGYQCVW